MIRKAKRVKKAEKIRKAIGVREITEARTSIMTIRRVLNDS